MMAPLLTWPLTSARSALVLDLMEVHVSLFGSIAVVYLVRVRSRCLRIKC